MRRVGRSRPGRRAALGGLALLAVLLAGCGAGTIFSLIDHFSGNDGDDDDAEATLRNLASIWEVRSYSGDDVGTVTVPTSAAMEWTFSLDGTWQVRSEEALPVAGQTRRYDERGQWRIRDLGDRIMRLTPTRRAGEPIDSGNRDDFEAHYTEQGDQLVLLTDVFGPGEIRYVMRRAQ